MKPKTFRRVVEVLKTNGWQFVRASGSHQTFHKPGIITIVTVLFHGQNTLIKIGTLKSIARQSGIPETEF
jgi:predicted RNA binding protein YcfA (HicA-like mRNA interferase family)